MAKLISPATAKLISKHLAKQVLDATLIVVTTGTRTTASGGTNPTTASRAAKGFVDSYETRLIDGSIIKSEDRKVTLLGPTIASGAVPTTNDKVTIEGVTYRIISVGRDPVGATYELQCRK